MLLLQVPKVPCISGLQLLVYWVNSTKLEPFLLSPPTYAQHSACHMWVFSQGGERRRGGKALAKVLNGIMLRWEWQSIGSQEMLKNKVSGLGQVHVGARGEGLVFSSENEDNSTSFIGRYEDQIKEWSRLWCAPLHCLSLDFIHFCWLTSKCWQLPYYLYLQPRPPPRLHVDVSRVSLRQHVNSTTCSPPSLLHSVIGSPIHPIFPFFFFLGGNWDEIHITQN